MVIPLRVRRPSAAREALCFSPLMESAEADQAGASFQHRPDSQSARRFCRRAPDTCGCAEPRKCAPWAAHPPASRHRPGSVTNPGGFRYRCIACFGAAPASWLRISKPGTADDPVSDCRPRISCSGLFCENSGPAGNDRLCSSRRKRLWLGIAQAFGCTGNGSREPDE
jgi:hypothetical protein